MRIQIALAIGVAASLMAPSPSPAATVLPTLNGQLPLIVGHRGATGYRPEETRGSYELAIKLGADYIEPDVISTKDGVLIARHEPNITNTTNVASHPEFAYLKTTKTIDGSRETGWFADDFTLAQIKTLRAIERLPFRDQSFNGMFEVLTLQEVIDIAKQGTKDTGRTIGVIPETKHPSYFQSAGLPLEQKLVDLLTANGYSGKGAPVIIQSFEVANLKFLHSITDFKLTQLTGANDLNADGTLDYNQPADFVLSGDKRTYGDLLTPRGLAEIATYADAVSPWKRSIVSGKYLLDKNGNPIDIDKDGAITDADRVALPPTSLISDAHRAGLLVIPYTWRNEYFYLLSDYKGDPLAEYDQFFRLGVDGLFTDFADMAVAGLQRALVVPEPASVGVLALGLAGLGVVRRRR